MFQPQARESRANQISVDGQTNNTADTTSNRNSEPLHSSNLSSLLFIFITYNLIAFALFLNMSVVVLVNVQIRDTLNQEAPGEFS